MPTAVGGRRAVARFDARQRLGVVLDFLRREIAVVDVAEVDARERDVEAAGLVAARETQIRRAVIAEPPVERELAADHVVVGIEAVARRVVKARAALLRSQTRRELEARAERDPHLTEERDVGRVVFAEHRTVRIERTDWTADRVLVDAEIEMIVAFFEIERVDADEPVAAPARDRAGLRQHAHLLVVRAPLAIVGRDVVVHIRRPIRVVAPVRVEAERRVRVGHARNAHDVDGRELGLHADRTGDRALRVAARLVRVRAEPVVDRPRVVAVVDVDVEAREIHLEPIARRPVELAASRELVARIGVVAAEEHVVAEAVALVLVQRSAIAERVAQRAADARRHRPSCRRCPRWLRSPPRKRPSDPPSACRSSRRARSHRSACPAARAAPRRGRRRTACRCCRARRNRCRPR